MSKDKRIAPAKAHQNQTPAVEAGTSDELNEQGETATPRYEEHDDAPDDGVTPSWFANTYGADDGTDLADRYRTTRAKDPIFETPSPEAYEAYRRRLEERFQSAKRIASGPAPAFSTMHEGGPGRQRGGNIEDEGSLRFREWQKKMNRRNGEREEGPQTSRVSALRIAGFFAGACAIGGIAGFGSANMATVKAAYEAVSGSAATGVATVAGWWPDTTQDTAAASGIGSAGGNTVLTKKPVKIARVAVADASGALNIPIPLDLTAIPAESEAPLALKITGLPGDAYLTQGTEIAEGEWMLKPAEIEGVKLVVPTAETPQIDLAVAAVEEKTGTQAAPPREMTVDLDLGAVKVLPANAAPEVQGNTGLTLPQAIPLPQEAENSEASTLFNKAEALLKTGDLVSARQFFIKAHSLGMGDAAYGAGKTYDPTVYAAMNVLGLQPDPAKALEWYKKAAASGHGEAQKAIETLNAAAQP